PHRQRRDRPHLRRHPRRAAEPRARDVQDVPRQAGRLREGRAETVITGGREVRLASGLSFEGLADLSGRGAVGTGGLALLAAGLLGVLVAHQSLAGAERLGGVVLAAPGLLVSLVRHGVLLSSEDPHSSRPTLSL